MPRETRFERELRTAVPPRSAAELLASGVTRHALARHTWLQTSRGR